MIGKGKDDEIPTFHRLFGDIPLHFPWLSFSDDRLEKNFIRSRAATNCRRMALGLMLPVVLYLLLGMVDYLVQGKGIESIPIIVRIFFDIPMLLIFAAISFFHLSFRLSTFITSLAPILAAIGNFLIVANVDNPTVYMIEIYMIVFWVFTTSGLSFKYAMISGTLTALVGAAEVLVAKDVSVISTNFHLLWIISAILLAALPGYLIEMFTRKSFANIVALKKAEEVIAAKEVQMRVAMENMPGGMFMVGENLNFRVVNNQYKEIFDFPDEAVRVGEPMSNAVRFRAERGDYGSGDVDQLVENRLNKYREGAVLHIVELLPNGRHVEFHIRPTGEGEMVGIATDITERKQAEEELASKEAQLRMAMENMPGAMVVVDHDLNVILVNDKYKEFYGDSDGLVAPGESMRDILKNEIDRGVLSGSGTPAEILEERINSYRPDSTMTFEDRTPDGRHIQLTRTPAPEGHTISVVVDITERKKAEVELNDAYDVISSSIAYASRIQRSVLPDDSLFTTLLDDHFVIWEPRDVVGGDIYWCKLWGNGLLIILGDCTGHGVPGAFMTLISTGALENALSEVVHGHVGKLLQRMHQVVQLTLGQHMDGGQSDDGMELGICYLTPDMDEIVFSGARFELHCIEDGNVTTTKGTKSGIGYHGIPHAQEYEEHVIGDLEAKSFYMTSDGLTDQIGGEKGRMFGKKRFKEVLLSNCDKPMSDQKDAAFQALLSYQADETRRDDVAVIGFKI